MLKQYYPNACCYCQRFDEDVQLIRCEKCNMVSYCCKLHQELDLPEHLDLCNAVEETFAENQLQVLKNIVHVSLKIWIQVKYKIIKEVLFKLKRPLQKYEGMMLMYPRTCIVCRKRIGELVNCPNCPFVSFCLEHKNNLTHEKRTCEQMAMYFKLKLFSEVQHSHIRNFMNDIKHVYPDNAHSMQDYFAFYESIRLKHNVSSDIFNAALSAWFTQALTVFHGLRITKFISNGGKLLIYIIIKDQKDLKEIWVWECIFHLLPTVTTLKLIYLCKTIKHINGDILPVCAECRKKNKTLMYFTYPLGYITSMTQYEKPDIFAVFDMPRLLTEIDKKSYSLFIHMLFEQRSSCIFTTNNLKNMDVIIKMIKAILQKDISPIYQEENPFKPISPMLVAPTESIEFENAYLCIYQDLSLNVKEENM